MFFFYKIFLAVYVLKYFVQDLVMKMAENIIFLLHYQVGINFQIKDNLISRSDAQALILAHDGDCALLHLWMALNESSDFERAARDLCMTRAQVDSAAEKLSRMFSSDFILHDTAGQGAHGGMSQPRHNIPYRRGSGYRKYPVQYQRAGR